LTHDGTHQLHSHTTVYAQAQTAAYYLRYYLLYDKQL
jgi:hypothetical protein